MSTEIELGVRNYILDTFTLISKVKVKSLCRVRLFATPWTIAHEAPSVGFSRQEYWSGCHFLLPFSNFYKRNCLMKTGLCYIQKLFKT